MIILKKMDIEEVKTFIRAQGPKTRIYVGGDSERFQIKGKWFADYTNVVVVHIDGCRGGRVFGEITREQDFDQNKDKPRMRLMNEVMKTAEMFLALGDIVDEYETDVHIDINPDEMHGSSCVVNEAIGYVRGMCNVTPKVKPAAFAASFGADRLKDIISFQEPKRVKA